MDEDETIHGGRFPQKMKHLASTQPRITYANVLAAGRVQFVTQSRGKRTPRVATDLPARRKMEPSEFVAGLRFSQTTI